MSCFTPNLAFMPLPIHAVKCYLDKYFQDTLIFNKTLLKEDIFFKNSGLS